MWAFVWCAAVWASDYDDLLSEDGWEHFETVSTGDAGVVVLDVKRLDTPCLRAAVTVELPADVLLEVVTDVPGASSITREKLIASEVLDRSGAQMEYYQHLDVPGWTLTADRYWVLRGERIQRPQGPMFRWSRFDWEGDYPELAERLASEYPSAIEPHVNWGAWTFDESEGKTDARYHLCSDAGGNLPSWIQKIAATRTIPATVDDVVKAAKRRLQALR
mgnify:CR=1 FL=1